MVQMSCRPMIDRRKVDAQENPGWGHAETEITTVVATALPSANLTFASASDWVPLGDSQLTAFASEETLARIWSHPAEDEAWRNL